MYQRTDGDLLPFASPNLAATAALTLNPDKEFTMREIIRKHAPVAVAVVATAALAASGPVFASSHGTQDAGKTTPAVKSSMARTSTAVDGFDTCAFTTIFSDTVNVPSNGYLQVWGSVSAARDTDLPDPAVLTTRIVVNGKIATIDTSAKLVEDGTDSNNIAMAGGVPVTKGAKTVAIKAYECTSGAAFIDSQELTTLFTKYGQSHVFKSSTKSTHENR